MYTSYIHFTLDTICPWTYLAKRRLDEALRKVRETPGVSEKVEFIVTYLPYQLYPNLSREGEDKYEWYKKSRYGNSDEKMQMYTTLMSAYGTSVGINFKFTGTIASTFHAHRIIQYYQYDLPDGPCGPQVSNAIVTSLYRQYFEEEKHPSSNETLLRACVEAGIEEEEAKKVIESEDAGYDVVKEYEQIQRSEGVDAVPRIRIEGRKRDFTFEGAREVEDYVKGLMSVVKESS